jgi:hypothetical protein
MELLMPSLAVLLAAVAIAFFVIPRMAPNVLIIASAVVLGLALYSHYNRFGITEYERATWIYNLGQYSGFIIVGVVIVGAYLMWGGMGSSSSNTPAAPTLNLPTLSGGGFDTIFETSSSRIRELLRKGRITV